MPSECETCSRIYVYSKAQGHTKKICNACVVNRRRRKIDQLILDYRGNSCERCGYDKCRSALHFHHKDPMEKDFGVSGNWGLSWKRIKKEIDKCELVCANCHAEIHNGSLA